MASSMLAVPVLFAAVAVGVPDKPLSNAYSYWRVTNYGDCGWRPAVREFMMYADTTMTQQFSSYELISSGYNRAFPEVEVGASRSVDGNPSTAWRPQIHAPAKGQVWIGMKFDRAVEVKAAKAVGLGVGQGGGKTWNGGVELQASGDGTNWVSVAHQSNSDDVVFKPRVMSNSSWRFDKFAAFSSPCVRELAKIADRMQRHLNHTMGATEQQTLQRQVLV